MTVPVGAARRVAVVGAGWAGLAAAVEAARRGHAVTLFEMAPQAGGRARRVAAGALALDNGQHILIGAYTETLRLLALVGVDAQRAFERLPLALVYPNGTGLALPPGPPVVAFARALLGQSAWPWRDRLALLATAARWAAAGFRCDERLTVAALTARLPPCVRDELIGPLTVAALNTPAADAAASVFLRVLRDALFAGRGASDLLLPRVDLGALWPDAVLRFLADHGADCRLATRVGALRRQGAGWAVDDDRFDAVVLAAGPVESARLAALHAPAWAGCNAALRHEPIVTVLLNCPGARLPRPMLALRASPQAPAQFVFDLGRLRGFDGVLAFVVSGATDWVARGLDATTAAVLQQARDALGALLPGTVSSLRTLAEKRATFLCTPGLARPAGWIADGLHAAGDHVAGSYPATLEGAMRSGVEAVRQIDAP